MPYSSKNKSPRLLISGVMAMIYTIVQDAAKAMKLIAKDITIVLNATSY